MAPPSVRVWGVTLKFIRSLESSLLPILPTGAFTYILYDRSWEISGRTLSRSQEGLFYWAHWEFNTQLCLTLWFPPTQNQQQQQSSQSSKLPASAVVTVSSSASSSSASSSSASEETSSSSSSKKRSQPEDDSADHMFEDLAPVIKTVFAKVISLFLIW